jgi:hypothetical protein
MSEVTRLTNDYVNWSGSNFTKYDSDTKIKVVSGNNLAVTHATYSRTFTLDQPASAAHISLQLIKFFYTGDNNGSARAVVTLIDPNSVSHTLYDDNVDEYTSFEEVLASVDITTYLALVGTYTLRVEGYVQSAYVDPGTYLHAEVHFSTILLTAAGVSQDINVDDVATPTEDFELLNLMQRVDDIVTPTEGFSIVKATAVAAQRPILIVATSSSHKVYTFESGAPLGRFETPEVDFALPGVDKTLEEIQVRSASPTPHIVNVYVSVDNGVTFDFISAISVSQGVVGYVHPWITAESFIIAFAGLGLKVFSYTLYARTAAEDTDDD